MDEEVFCHGAAGQWIFAISDIRQVDGTISVSADISHRGTQRCRLIFSQRGMSRDELVEVMRGKCLAWIEDAESSSMHRIEGGDMSRSVQAAAASAAALKFRGGH